jgi:hypothetical protein
VTEPFVIAAYVATYGVVVGYLVLLWRRRRTEEE